MVEESIFISAPSCLQISKLECGSAPSEKFLIIDLPCANEEKITARWETDLSAGIVTIPLRVLKFLFTRKIMSIC